MILEEVWRVLRYLGMALVLAMGLGGGWTFLINI